VSGAAPPWEVLLRELAPQVLGVLVRRYGDFDTAEDAVQEALLAAATQWPAEGMPDNPRGWLIQVAQRRLVDAVRGEVARRRREESAALRDPDRQVDADVAESVGTDRDDSLLLLFLCCHSALPTGSAIALTLRAIGGLSTVEIARAFLVPEATMAQRITRAKRTLRTQGEPFARPDPTEWAARLRAVLHVLYLIFNEGYAASSGPALQRVELSAEAIRLTRMVHRTLPEDPEVAGLLALMLLTDARRAARVSGDGRLVPLDEQDRTLWDRDRIAEGVALVSAALPRGAVGPYQLQAAVAAVHDEAPRAQDTDWAQIAALYAVLERVADSPMVRLNRAIAVAMVDGPSAGLALLEPLEGDERMADRHRLDAVRAHLLERAGDLDGAQALYRRAAARTASAPEQQYLLDKAARLSAAG
jgi:RNA polymerase sigma factor (sigma-70 family)